MDEVPAHVDVPVSSTSKGFVEPTEEGTKWSSRLLPRAQQEGRKRRAESEGIKRGEEYRNCDRNCELFIELSCYAGNEGSGNKYSGQDKTNGNDRARDFLHRFDCSVVRRQPMLDMVFHCLHDDNGIIDNQPDRKHESEK